MKTEVNQPKVSVIIPVYNVEKYLCECLDSVLSQTLTDIEIICVDDCSSDRSATILKEYACKNNRIKVIAMQENQGVSIARNIGLDVAIGQYIFFLDSDDWMQPETLQCAYLSAKASGADITMLWSHAFLDGYNQLKDCANDMSAWLSSDVCGIHKLSYDEIHLRQIPCVVWGKLYRTAFINQHELRFICKKIAHEDTGFWLKCLAQRPNFQCINDVGVMYRIRNDSTMASQVFAEDKEKLAVVFLDVIEYVRTHVEQTSVDEVFKAFDSLFRKLRIPGKMVDGKVVFTLDGTKYRKYRLLSMLTFGNMRKKISD